MVICVNMKEHMMRDDDFGSDGYIVHCAKRRDKQVSKNSRTCWDDPLFAWVLGYPVKVK